ncbi:hypothetical protein [Paenibacillus piri]|uniref:Uncharacterized protein n=1 Tax=Paenibacillus piri TaxID=2547395 RepID=A0A4R5KLZ2_9BACL|nr:hypothetical protein [Paenibacillus piri]TDF96609.1 hypothetical protein E1757_16060 [Paenibacillus piri]
MLFSNSQKQLILEILMKERRRIFSKHRGELLNKTIADLQQMARNESVNAPKTSDNSIDWSSRSKRK